MGNVYYSAALIAQHIYYSEEMRHLILGQGRRRLIENYNLSIIRNRFRNFDHLPLRHRHFTHHGSRVDIDPEFIENLLCRIVHLSFACDRKPLCNRRKTAEPHIVHDVALQCLIELLMHHRNAVFECFL